MRYIGGGVGHRATGHVGDGTMPSIVPKKKKTSVAREAKVSLAEELAEDFNMQPLSDEEGPEEILPDVEDVEPTDSRDDDVEEEMGSSDEEQEQEMVDYGYISEENGTDEDDQEDVAAWENEDLGPEDGEEPGNDETYDLDGFAAL